MEAERRTSKGSFFQLFDWNSKSRKKLFANKSELSDTETSKQRNQNVVKSLNYPNLLEVRENGHDPIGKRNGEYISSSLATDDIYGKKAPGVVARLMGLDSLPNSSASETVSTSFPSNSRFEMYNSDFRIDYHYVNNIPNERRRPIERFQSEMLPPKSAKQISESHHHRLLSPIKNPRYIPTNDLAYIMEASSKIIDQSPQSGNKDKKLHFVSSSVPLRLRDVRERMEVVPRPKKPVVSQYNRRPSREKNDNESINTQIINNKPIISERENSGRLKNKGKSGSLAVQAKVNVQRKERLNLSNSKRSVNRNKVDEAGNSPLHQSQITKQRNVQNNISSSRTSGVHNQSQKQKYASEREKLPPKALVPIQKNRKSPPVSGGSVRPVKAINKKLPPNTIAKDTRKEIMSSKTNLFSEKEQLGCGDIYFEETIGDNITMNNDNNKEIKCNITHDDCLRWDEGEMKSSMDVVSFTFTSPIKKSHTLSPEKIMENGNIYCDDINCSPKIKTLCSPRSNVTGGDALSVLLEQKLKELTCRVESSNSNFEMSPNGKSIGFEINLRKNKSTVYDVDCSSSNGLGNKAYGKWQGLQEIEGESSGNSKSNNKKEHEHRYASLMSTLEPSSSDRSSDSLYSNNISITKGNEMIGCISNNGVSETLDIDLDFSDSASSSSVAYVTGNSNSSTISSIEFKRSANWELEYIRKVIFSSDLALNDLVLGQVNKDLNPNLFDHLENSQIVSAEDAEEYFKLERKVLFDGIGEYLNLRGEQLLGGNSNALSKWEILFRNKGFLADDLYKEISSWTSMGDLMVDELVDRDMSLRKGKWVDFEIEAFEEGLEIEKALLSSLMDELIFDFLFI